jgi:hypothetical protein
LIELYSNTLRHIRFFVESLICPNLIFVPLPICCSDWLLLFPARLTCWISDEKKKSSCTKSFQHRANQRNKNVLVWDHILIWVLFISFLIRQISYLMLFSFNTFFLQYSEHSTRAWSKGFKKINVEEGVKYFGKIYLWVFEALESLSKNSEIPPTP